MRNYSSDTGVSFMNSVITYFSNRRSHANSLSDAYRKGESYVHSNGKKMFFDFKWEGEELVIDNKDVRDSSSSTPTFSIDKELAYRIGWFVLKEDGNDIFGPNLRAEFSDNTILDIAGSARQGDVFLANNTPVLWALKNDGMYALSQYCNWRFMNLNVAFQKMVLGFTCPLFVYSDACTGAVVGGQVTDFLREVPYTPQGDGNHYFEPVHLHYLPTQRSVLNSIEIQVAEESGKLAELGEGNTTLSLHFKKEE